ncbi:sigma-54 interaction domain-containing protein [Aminipila luticellarii]|uniref:AAA family ATPase n=1 Tax=Aminipila luticellarii TaxID=2507160 RepID=A0A410PVL2_9FIRM|nr:sigma 54-interacting transcriptional regulator [Aminipila luticellarii]QAT42981.1 AAA family ATPase [Aminipila luticellarii]
MKKVALLFKNKENQGVITYLRDTLYHIFEGYIEVKDYFISELRTDEQIEADAYLMVYEDMIYQLKNHISNFYKLILLGRSIRKEFLHAMLEIPKDTEVLIVNDTYETAIQTTYTFYELGISHLNLIPYDKELAAGGAYDHIEYAITPNEEDLVPETIGKIVNIGYREISFDTLLKLMRKLDLDNDVVNRNLIRHLHTIIEPNPDYHDNYYNSYLKGKLLNRVVDNSLAAIIMLNDNLEVVYFNDKADSIFETNMNAPFTYIDESLIRGEDLKNYPLVLEDENYIFEKTTIKLMDEAIGYLLNLQSEKILHDIEINLKNYNAKKGLVAKHTFQDIIYRSDSMAECIAVAKQVAKTDYTILIRGATGTGKELMAQSIHNYSNRSRAPFVAVNCAAIPETLLESELFGYEGGAFTGAQKNGKLGFFEKAHTGTLFLDEIGDLSVNLQTRLLRAIQEKQIMRIGSDKVIDVDIRIIAATNSQLEEAVAKGKFRADLFYRLNVVPVFLKPISQRKDDILPLLKFFLGRDYSKVAEDEKRLLEEYQWPGNIRQLQSAGLYYKTLGKFPEYLYEKNSRMPADSLESTASAKERKNADERIPMDIKTVSQRVLREIYEATQAYHGIGRSAMLGNLTMQGIKISDGKLRTILAELEAQGLVSIKCGRCGTQITEKGIQFIRQL